MARTSRRKTCARQGMTGYNQKPAIAARTAVWRPTVPPPDHARVTHA